jgi:hypothetical protein
MTIEEAIDKLAGCTINGKVESADGRIGLMVSDDTREFVCWFGGWEGPPKYHPKQDAPYQWLNVVEVEQ